MPVIFQYQCDLCFKKTVKGLTLTMKQNYFGTDYNCTTSRQGLINTAPKKDEMIKHICEDCAHHIACEYPKQKNLGVGD